MTPKIRARRLAALMAVGALVLGAAACGGDDDDTTSSGSSGKDKGSDSGAMTVKIADPADGSDVSADGFTVKFDPSVDVGAPDTGKNHIHLFYDGNDSDYEVVNGKSFDVPSGKLEEGEHTLKAVIANADHSLTDASDEITVNVGSGGSDDGGGSDTTDDSGY
jgi:hypothetical protein